MTPRYRGAMTRSLVVLLVACVVTGSGCWRKRAVRSVARAEATVSAPRALALGVTTAEIFRASKDNCITGQGKLDIRINCIPNFGSLELSDVKVDDPNIVSATLEPRNGGSSDTAVITLRALAVGRTTLRARSHVGLAVSDIVVPLEVAVPDRVVLEGFEELLLSGRRLSGLLHVFHGEQELDWSGLRVLTLEGPGTVEVAGRGYSLQPGATGGRITSPYDPRLSLTYDVFSLSEVSLKVDVLPEEKCERVVMPHVTARGKPVSAVFGMGFDVVVDVKYPFDTCAPHNPPQGLVSKGLPLKWTGGKGECRIEVSIRNGTGPHTRVETVVELARPCVR